MYFAFQLGELIIFVFFYKDVGTQYCREDVFSTLCCHFPKWNQNLKSGVARIMDYNGGVVPTNNLIF